MVSTYFKPDRESFGGSMGEKGTNISFFEVQSSTPWMLGHICVKHFTLDLDTSLLAHIICLSLRGEKRRY